MRYRYILAFLSIIACTSYGSHIVPVTIWIHGTDLQSIFPIQIPGMQNCEPCPQGLHAATTVHKDFSMRLMADTLAHASTQEFPLSHMYLFGWSGKLDGSERFKYSQLLFNEITQLAASYKRYNCIPKFTLICHSHGGNVALQLALHSTNPTFEIERLILLACPVQTQTESLTQHPLFKRIYSFHSTGDLIQILDLQGLHPWREIAHSLKNISLKGLKEAWKLSTQTPFFSQRLFAPQPHLINIKTRWHKTMPWTVQDIEAQPYPFRTLLRYLTPPLQKPHAVLHNEFILPSFLEKLPGLIHEAHAYCNQEKPEDPITLYV